MNIIADIYYRNTDNDKIIGSDRVTPRVLKDYLHQGITYLLPEQKLWISDDLRKVLDEFGKEPPKFGNWLDYTDEGFVECPYCGAATNCNNDVSELHYCFSCGKRLTGVREP